MKKMNKKGFTLIELLTVIAILAVILLIAAPTILGVLDKARKNTFKNQVLLYVESMKTQIALRAMGAGYADVKDVDSEEKITEGLYCTDAGVCKIDVDAVPMESKSLKAGGIITITLGADGTATYALTNVTDGTYYYTGADTAITAETITKEASKTE